MRVHACKTRAKEAVDGTGSDRTAFLLSTNTDSTPQVSSPVSGPGHKTDAVPTPGTYVLARKKKYR